MPGKSQLLLTGWKKERGPRLQGSRPLDSSKVQAPCIVRVPSGGYRLFYTAIGPGKPFDSCQGYILSALSEDGIKFQTEPGIRLAPRPELPHMSLRVLAPSVTQYEQGRWRMYFESRGPASRPPVICSATSSDLLDWNLEEGIRLESSDGVGGPRYLSLSDECGRIYCCGRDSSSEEQPKGKGVVSAITSDGLNFRFEPGYRFCDRATEYVSNGITAAEVFAPSTAGDDWIMVYSAWEDVPPGTIVPPHPSSDMNAEASGSSADFATASIASDMAGYRSRIFVATSENGLEWERSGLILEGAGYNGEGLDAVHAEDMSLIELGEGAYRMVYAACDKDGNWRIASAVNSG